METLIVDDDEMTLFLHEVFVKESNFSIQPKVFASAEEALKYLRPHCSHEKTFCVFLDLNMPVMDGWEFLDAIEKEGIDGKIKVVILTSSVNDKDRKRSKKYATVIDYLEKPLTQIKLEVLKKSGSLNFFV